MKKRFAHLDMDNDKIEFFEQDVPSSLLDLSPGCRFSLNGVEYVIIVALDNQSLLCRNRQDGKVERLDVNIIVSSQVKVIPPEYPDMLQLSDKDWKVAQERYEVIRPILENLELIQKANLVNSRAEETNISAVTIWRWLARYAKYKRKSALVPRKRKDKGHLRLNREVEQIIRDAIQNLYLTKQKITPGRLVQEVVISCKKRKIPPPHPNTIRNRLQCLPKKVVHVKRHGAHSAAAQYDPVLANYDEANRPLAVVQIDHTLADIMLVDDKQRAVLGRPWLTVAIDVFSRMVIGVYISLDPPSAASVGICVTSAILPKEGIMIEHDITADWPVWGKMEVLHADNAKEFHSDMLTKACGEHGIDIYWRPVKKPNYGGHIERLIGTLSKEIHFLPGTTFSNPKERGNYDSEKQAALTVQEFTKWLLTHILRVYHNKVHSGINTTPLAKFKEGLNMHGIPPRAMDDERLRLDFLPCVERSIQRHGVAIDGVVYYHDSLRRWIRSKEDGKPRQFIFRRDPRDISTVWFFDPELNKYFPVPFKNNTYGFTSLWEFRRAKDQARQRANGSVSEEEIFRARDEMREIVESAVAHSKKARRQQQRLKESRRMTGSIRHSGTSEENLDYEDLGIDISSIKPFPVDESE